MATIQIDLLGTSFSIKTDEDVEYMRRLLHYYKKMVEEVATKGIFQNPLQISIMAGVMMCEEVYKDKKERQKVQAAYKNDTSDDGAQRIIDGLIEKIDGVL